METVFIRLKKIPSLIFPLYAPEIFKILLIIISIGLTPPFDSFPDSVRPDDFPTFCDKEGSCLIVLSVFQKLQYVPHPPPESDPRSEWWTDGEPLQSRFFPAPAFLPLPVSAPRSVDPRRRWPHPESLHGKALTSLWQW